MKVRYTVYWEDGSSGIIEIEKPAGSHPDSISALAEGVRAAESCGKRVAKIGRSKINPLSKPGGPLVIDDNLLTREYIRGQLKGTTGENLIRP